MSGPDGSIEPHVLMGRKIRARRLSLGMTLEELEEACGLRASFLGQIERGVKRASLESIVCIADALGMPIGRLFSADGVGRVDDDQRVSALLSGHNPGERDFLMSSLRHMSKKLRVMRKGGV